MLMVSEAPWHRSEPCGVVHRPAGFAGGGMGPVADGCTLMEHPVADFTCTSGQWGPGPFVGCVLCIAETQIMYRRA